MKIADLGKGYAGLNTGGWVGNIPFPLLDDVRLKVRRLWNPDHSALNDQLTAAAMAKLPAGTTELDAATRAEIERECLAGAVLIGWDGVDEAFTPDLAIEAMADPDAGPSFRSAVLWSAGKLADQVKAQLEADGKN